MPDDVPASHSSRVAIDVGGTDLGRVSMFTHGTTLAVNALLTRSGARTAVSRCRTSCPASTGSTRGPAPRRRYGHPHDREPGRGADDVRNGYVSAEAARRDYGVVIDPVTFAVDETATARCRERQA